MNQIAMLAVVGTLAVIGAGCINGRIGGSEGDRYAAPDDPIPSGNGYATSSDLDAVVQQLLGKMRAHKAFKTSYAELHKKKGSLPVLEIGDIASPARLPFSSKCRLEILKEKLVTSVFESGLFSVYDNGDKETIKADLELSGTLRAIREAAGCNVYRLQLCLKDRATGLIVWMGAETLVKFR